MAEAFALPAPGLKPLDLLMTGAIGKPSADSKTKAKAAAQNFEAVFLNSMFQEMFTDIGGEGPFGGMGAAGVWRSLLTDEYAKSFAKAGGIGMANQVYKALLAQQEGHS
jgi:Rod binding domain-containing protein